MAGERGELGAVVPATTVEAGSVGRESGEDSEEDPHPAISIAVAVIAIRR